jgi:TRAP-type C4-dicarboxylate transport system permease small subunit
MMTGRNGALERVTGVNDWLARLLLWLGGAGLVAMTGIVGWQVFARYVLNDSPSWSEQLTLLLMIWYALLAAAAGFQQGFHIRIAALETRVRPARARALRMLGEGFVFLAGLLFLVWGVELAALVHTHVIPSLGVSRAWAYAPLAIVGALVMLFAGTRLAGEILRPGWTEHREPDSIGHEPSDDPDVASTIRAARAARNPRQPYAPPSPHDRSGGRG